LRCALNLKGEIIMNPCRVWIRIEELPQVWVEELKKDVPGVEFRRGADADAAPEWISTADAVFTNSPLPDALVEKMTALRWVQFTRGSAFELIHPALRESSVAVSVIRGIDGVQFSESAIGFILAWAKGLPLCFKAQQEKRWEVTMPMEVSGMTLGVLGLGTIGSETARKAKAFGMRVLGIKRTVKVKPDYVDDLWTPDRLPDLLSQSDFLVISIPSSPETFDLLGIAELKRMKKTACLINLTGGRVIAEEHLVQALKDGWIAGAALDAFPRQPLPPDSALWSLPNVIISPRIAGFSPNRWKRLIPVFAENLRKFVSSQPMDLIDKKVGF
jgi:phosphoglycerate dehydrogenase-like enzyme